MSGGNCPETPRQKMIGMMYLFYTALLALNVSAEVIDAFVKVDASITQTTENFTNKTAKLYSTISMKYEEQRGKYAGLKAESDNIQKSTDSIFTFIEELKVKIIKESGEIPENNPEAALKLGADNKITIQAGFIKKKDNLEASHKVMGDESGQDNQGKALKEKLNVYRDYLLSIVKDSSQTVYKSIATSLATYEGTIETKDGPRYWAQKYYQAMPLIGTIALLSKLQADVRNAESDILEFMIKDLEGLDIRITSLEGLVSAPKSFIVRGGEYTSKIFLGALDTTMRPIVHMTSSKPFWDTEVVGNDTIYKLRQGVTYDTLVADETGKANYTVTCGSVGEFEYGGLVHYKSNTGDKWLPFTGSYQVGDAGFTVSATKCNVLYKGLENPIAVSVAGYPKEGVNASISAGSIVRAPGGGWIAKLPPEASIKEVKISVSVTTPEGTKALGSVPFKVFDVPPPTIMIAGTYKDGATMPKAAIMQNPYLFAGLGTGFFPFDGIKYSVTKYDFMYSERGVATRNTYSGSQIAPDVLAKIRAMGSKSQVSFTNIRYSGPSGEKSTNGVSVILQ